MQLFSRLFLCAAFTLLTSCAVGPIVEGQFFIGSHLVKTGELKASEVSGFLADDWAKFDKHVKDAPDMFSKMRPVSWRFELTPPFPTNWPPKRSRSVTYYAYAEYQEFSHHGPVLSRSAPWAKVILTEGKPADKVILASAVGPVKHGEGSVPITREQADRKIQIIKDGEARLNSFISWRTIPADEGEVKSIREYYCQWERTDRTADLIREDHRAFFEWLSCPPHTRIPVLHSPH
jgi:hypothetical protein